MITLKNISKIYTSHNKETIALKNINITLPDSGLITITGRSGSGKTTLVNIFSSLDKQTSGEIITNYQDEHYSTIIFQDAQLIPEYSVYKNLKLIMDLFGIMDDNILDELLIKYELEDLKDNFINEISGGQKQRVAIIRAILSSRPVIVCDEPTSSLDEESATIVVNELKELSKNRLVIVVTHEIDFFKKCSDRIIELKNGSIVKDNIFNESNNIYNELKEYNKINYNKKNIISLSFFNINRNKVRTIFLILTLFISFLGFSFALNLSFSSKFSMKVAAYNDADIEVLNFIKTKYDDPLDSMTDADYASLSKYKGMKTIESSFPLYYDNDKSVKILGAYINSVSPFKVIYGNKELKEDEIIISTTLAKRLMQYLGINSYNGLLLYDDYSMVLDDYIMSDFLGEKKKITVKISGIYESNDKIILGDGLTEYIICNESILSKKSKLDIDTFYKKEGSSYLPIIIGNSSDYVKSTIEDYLLLGSLVSNKNEVVISSTIAFELTKNPNYFNADYQDYDNLIGRQIEVDLLKLSYFDANSHKFDSSINRKQSTLNLKIVGITKGDAEYIISNDLYDEIYNDFSLEKVQYGFGYSGKITSKVLKNMKAKNYIDCNIYSEVIEDEISLLKSLSIIAYVVGVAFMIMGIFISLNYITNSIKRKKSIIGILSSFGVEKKGLVKILFIDIFIYLTAIMLVISLIHLPIIAIMNNFLVSKKILQFRLLSFNFISSLCIIVLIIFWIALYYLICYSKIKKRSKIDLVYDR